MTITEFLMARIAEDEEAARAAMQASAQMAHIALHDPARVLAECEAKRRIVDFALMEATGTATRQLDAGELPERTEWVAVAALAEVYADHPDYREEWKL